MAIYVLLSARSANFPKINHPPIMTIHAPKPPKIVFP